LLKQKEQISGGDSVPNTQRQIHHEFFPRNYLASTSEPPQMMARIAVIMLNGDRVSFTGNVTVRRQDFGEGIPLICVKSTIFQMLDLII
jgi:hypothetical protein